MSDVTIDTQSVVVERHLAHAPSKIWRALTEPHLIADWLMQNDFAAQTGHKFKLSADWGHVDCEVIEIEQEKSLSYKWDAMGLFSVVTFTLMPDADGTLLRLEQTGFRDDQVQALQGAKYGWPRFFDSLETLLARVE